VNFNLDGEGYLVDRETWDEDVARAIAENEGIGTLTDEMMDVIRFMRSYYNSYNSFPILNSVCLKPSFESGPSIRTFSQF